MRAGTVNVAGAVAMATALRTTVAQRADEVARVSRLRDRLLDGLDAAVDGLFENGDRAGEGRGELPRRDPRSRGRGAARRARPRRRVRRGRIVVLVGRDRAVARARGDGRAASRGALASIRLSLGFASTDADVDTALELVPTTVATLRGAAVAAS